MSRLGIIISAISGLIMVIVLAFALELGGLEWRKFFAPRKANIERQVFEQTKSYTHGMTTSLAKRYEEYTRASGMDDKQIVENLVKMEFADFDANTIRNAKLRAFLVNIRGY